MMKFRELFQFGYLFTWLFIGIGISGNIELGVETPYYLLVIFTALSVLVAGKMIYWMIEGPIKALKGE